MIIEHRTREKHQNADSLSKKTEFYERHEQRGQTGRRRNQRWLLFYGQGDVRQPSTNEVTRNVRETNRGPYRATSGASRENNSEEKSRDANGSNAQVENNEGNTKGNRLRFQ